MTPIETEVAPRIHWNFFVGFVAAPVAVVLAYATYRVVGMTVIWVDGHVFRLAQSLYLTASVVYVGLTVTQVVFTVRTFRREAAARLYVPGLVFTIISAVMVALAVPLVFAIGLYFYSTLTNT